MNSVCQDDTRDELEDLLIDLVYDNLCDNHSLQMILRNYIEDLFANDHEHNLFELRNMVINYANMMIDDDGWLCYQMENMTSLY